jgi:uncharacterized RDD family membrane protein YckC
LGDLRGRTLLVTFSGGLGGVSYDSLLEMLLDVLCISLPFLPLVAFMWLIIVFLHLLARGSLAALRFFPLPSLPEVPVD